MLSFMLKMLFEASKEHLWSQSTQNIAISFPDNKQITTSEVRPCSFGCPQFHCIT